MADVQHIVLVALLVLETGIIVAGQDAEYPACNANGITVNGTLGTVSSPNYPSNYPDDLTCTWIIQSPEGTRIAVRFELLFSVETAGLMFCYDSVTFSETGRDDVLKVTSTSLRSMLVAYLNDINEEAHRRVHAVFLFQCSHRREALCGENVPSSFVSLSNALKVVFFSDSFITYPGFSFNWTAVANTSVPDPVRTMLHNDSGTISSLGYPSTYPALLQYTWIVNASAGKYILLEFEKDFGIEGVPDNTCPYDALVISEGIAPPNIFSDKVELCGFTTPSRKLLKSNQIYVTFRTDLIVHDIGFSFKYMTIDPPVCNGLTYQNGTSGVVSTPEYPLGYERYQACSWLITAPENTHIAVRFNSPFSIASSTRCSVEFLELYDGPNATSETKPGKEKTKRAGKNATEGQIFHDLTEDHSGFATSEVRSIGKAKGSREIFMCRCTLHDSILHIFRRRITRAKFHSVDG